MKTGFGITTLPCPAKGLLFLSLLGCAAINLIILHEVRTIYTIEFDRWLWGGEVWDIEAVEDHLEINLPEDAKIIEFEAGWERFTPILVKMRFRTNEIEAHQFASQICDGKLFPGYDPYQATNEVESTSTGYPITIWMEGNYDLEKGLQRTPFTYYSYSSGVPPEIVGNRCVDDDFGDYLIRLDKTTEGVVEITFDYSSQCNVIGAYEIIPCNSLHPYLTPQ